MEDQGKGIVFLHKVGCVYLRTQSSADESSEAVRSDCENEEVSISLQDLSDKEKEPLCCEPPPSLPAPSFASALSDDTFQRAAAIFQKLREEKPIAQQLLLYAKKTNTPLPLTTDKTTEIQAYQLAFSTLKYQDLLEYMITDSCFHASQNIPGDMLPLVMVMLCYFQERKFSLHSSSSKDEQERHQDVKDLFSSLDRCKTKLAASLARFRVKQSLRSVSSFLLDPVRTKQHQAKSLPLYVWVNTLMYSIEEVCEALQSAGFCEVKCLTELKELSFCRDSLCSDTLVFSKQLHVWLQTCSLTAEHIMNIQERSLCVAVNALRPLLFDAGDVLMAGSFSAVTVAHVAVAAAARSGRVLVCCADHAPSLTEEIKQLVLTQMNLKNVRILSESFFELNEWENTVQHLKVILVLPQCSSSALNDPVPIMHSEHGDWELLTHLSHGSVSKSKINTLISQQALLLGQALSFPKVQTVVYCTRSEYPEENAQLVKRVLEKTRTHPKLLPFRVNGPIFPDDSLSEDTAESKYFSLQPSQFTNGCFIARLSRQADPTKVETVQDVLARAAAKGLLGGILPEQSKASKKGKGKKSHQAGSHNEQEAEGAGDAEDEEDQGEEDEGEKKDGKSNKVGKKKKGGKGHKGKAKQTKSQSKGAKKKVKKRKVDQSKQKPRRIPRLTLSLMSSANASARLSLITPLVKKLKDNTALTTTSSETSSGSSTPARTQQNTHSVGTAQRTEAAQKQRGKTRGSGEDQDGETKVHPGVQGKIDRDKDEVENKVLKPVDSVAPLESLFSSSSLTIKSDTSASGQKS
ncbi:putative methyltransferase NSUN7 [Eucyclogobius newberryi]|uniref:putative methyltransferase NSUN7 n=1 Tax=Eucyclogobius newberryi TaxID=166745 RepID=UPI003B5C1830